MEEDLSIYSRVTESKEGNSITRVIVVRHAESIANAEGKYQGQTYDTDLSELGKKQAIALAERISAIGIKKIITSPLKRTHQTATHVAEVIKCDIEFNHQIIETNHGLWEGNHKDWIKENYPDLFETWQKSPLETIFPEGESFIDTIRRTLEFLEKTQFSGDTLVITHDNILRTMISLVSNLDLNRMWEIPLESTSVNVFEVNRVNGVNRFRILSLNNVEHLKGIENKGEKHAL